MGKLDGDTYCQRCECTHPWGKHKAAKVIRLQPVVTSSDHREEGEADQPAVSEPVTLDTGPNTKKPTATPKKARSQAKSHRKVIGVEVTLIRGGAKFDRAAYQAAYVREWRRRRARERAEKESQPKTEV